MRRRAQTITVHGFFSSMLAWDNVQVFVSTVSCSIIKEDMDYPSSARLLAQNGSPRCAPFPHPFRSVPQRRQS